MSGATTVLLALVVASPGCATPPARAPAPARREGARTVTAVPLPTAPQPIVIGRSVREQVTTSRPELEGIAMHSDDREAKADALFDLALLDIDAEEAAWDGPDPEFYAAAARTRAVGNLRQLIDQVPRARRRDDALYLLGVCLENAHDDRGALDAFDTLLVEHRTSRHVPEVLFRLGEIQFDRGNNPEAARFYEAVARLTDSSFATVALYKLGWTHYRHGFFGDAADAFARMLARPDTSAEAVALRPEATRLLEASRAHERGHR